MDQLTSDQLKKAFYFWHRNYKHVQIDERVDPFLTDKVSAFEISNGGWLRKVRTALFLSTGKGAERLKMPRSHYCKLEKKEELGAIPLYKVAEIAEAMDCELIYAIRPKKKVRFSVIIWQKLIEHSIGHNWVRTRPNKFKANALAAIAKQKMTDPEFRRLQEWSER